VLHEAAIFNRVPEASEFVNAAPVPARIFAGTVVRNYETCHVTASRLIGLQDWVQGQHEAYLAACKSEGVNCSKDK
jgi:hypothetical protein